MLFPVKISLPQAAIWTRIRMEYPLLSFIGKGNVRYFQRLIPYLVAIIICYLRNTLVFPISKSASC
jgi:hypothetical protein